MIVRVLAAALLAASCLVPSPRGYGYPRAEPLAECREVVRSGTRPACEQLCRGEPEPSVPALGLLVTYGGADGDTCICEASVQAPTITVRAR